MSPLVFIPQHFGALVFDRRNSRYFPFDRESAELLRASMHTPLEHLVARASPDERACVGDFFDRFYDLGFFTPERTFAGVALDLTAPADHLAGPLAAHLEISASCNLTCTHCFAGELPRRESALTLAELDTLFADLAAVGTFRLGLTGGEPLLRKDLFELLDLALARGLHPCLTTNALLLNERIADALGARDLVWLNVSLEGASARTNDPVRGAGTFDRVLEKLRILRGRARFTLAFTITRDNAHEARACAELAAEVGAHNVVFRPLYPTGIALDHPELMPTFAQYTAALDAIATVSNGEVHAIDPFSPQSREAEQASVHPYATCGAGTSVCSISLGGDVNPCSFLGSAFVGGNVRTTPFRTLWNSAQTFVRMRAPTDFQGGCRARSLAFRGSVDAADPWITDEAPAASARRHPLTVLHGRASRPT